MAVKKPGKKRSLTRRVFMLGSIAVTGGVAFGIYQYKKPVTNPLVEKQDEVILNPYLVITEDGVTIIAPRAEMGQGIHTMLAALVAEELDIAWEEITVIHGPASSAYFNTEILKLALPFSDYARSGIKDLAHDAVGVGAKLLGQQITGGSTSTRDAFVTMRKAGAAARMVLIEAASEELNIPVENLTTKNGFVIADDGTALSYQDLALDAAVIKVPDNPPLKPRTQWRYLGRDMARFDMVEKVSGTAKFGIDIRRKDMLHATVRINPRLGGEMRTYDAAEASVMRGVHTIVDLGNGIGVIADNTWRAFQAAKAVIIEWGEAPYPATTDGIFEEIEKAFEGDPNSTLRDDGNIITALEPDADIIEATYRVPYLAHTTMEPMNATALSDNGELDIWVGNQAPTLIREKVADLAGLPLDKVRVHTPFMGGGFGRRAEFDTALHAAQLALAVPGHPVQMTWTREEDTRHDYYRPAAIARMKGVVTDFLPSALKADIAAASVFRQQSKRALGLSPPGADKLLVEGAFDQPYAILNYQVNGYISNVSVPVGAWRSVGNSHNCFFHECFLDELAVSQKIDPLAMRLNLMKDLDPASSKVVQTVGDIAGWGAPTGAGLGRGPGFGRGIAFCLSFGSRVALIVDVSEQQQGIRIDRVWCAIDVGRALDPRNIKAQVMSAVIYGLTAAVHGSITFKDGEVVEGNFDEYDALRMVSAPEITTVILQSGDHIGGVGEAGTPPAMPALANAVFNLTGKRIRELPLGNHFDFV